LTVASAAGSTTTVGDGTGTSGTVVQAGSGKIKVGATGTTFTAMGACSFTTAVAQTTAVLTQTCTGVPASTNVAVHCSAGAAFSTPTANGVYCRANGTLNQIICNTHAANTVNPMTFYCMWMQL
jgi:hypothetical protein